MALLKTDYKNDVLDLASNPDRKFRQVDNGDGTYSYTDETVYSQVGDAFGANDINATNIEVNALNSSVANVLGDFATVESTTTASKAYDVGDYLVMNGMFYKVTAAIAQGNALTVGGNIEATNVGAEISSLNKDLANIMGTTTTLAAGVAAPCDGILHVQGVPASTSAFGRIRIGERYATIYSPTGGTTGATTFIRKGEAYYIDPSNVFSSTKSWFVPLGH